MKFKMEKSAAVRALSFLFSLVVAFAPSAQASDQKCKTGQVTEARGEVLRESPLQAKVEHLKSGVCIADGQALITRKNSALDLSLSSGSTVSVAPEAEVLVGFPIGGKPTKLNVTRGEIRVHYTSLKDGPVINLLRLTITQKTSGTTLLGEVFHDGQEAWLVVTRGSAIARLGNEGTGIELDTGQSVYITESQKELPRVVSLDSREMETLAQDHAFKQTISQLLMVEAGAEAKPESAVDSDQDLTLEQYAAQERANKKKPTLPPPPVVTNLPLVPMPHETPIARPLAMQPTPLLVGPPAAPRALAPILPPSLPQRPESPPQSIAVQPSPQATPFQSVSEGSAIEKPDVATGLPSFRLEIGPSFYSDATGYELGATYLVPMSHVFNSLNDYTGAEQWSIGGGLGYSHAGKDTLSVSNWKFVAIANYRFHLSRAISLLPEFSVGAAIESVSVPLKTVASGAAFYYSPDLLFELNIERAPHFHPGIALIEQGYLGGASLTSVATEFSMRFEF